MSLARTQRAPMHIVCGHSVSTLECCDVWGALLNRGVPPLFPVTGETDLTLLQSLHAPRGFLTVLIPKMYYLRYPLHFTVLTPCRPRRWRLSLRAVLCLFGRGAVETLMNAGFRLLRGTIPSDLSHNHFVSASGASNYLAPN
jgi:hypothetical protein